MSCICGHSFMRCPDCKERIERIKDAAYRATYMRLNPPYVYSPTTGEIAELKLASPNMRSNEKMQPKQEREARKAKIAAYIEQREKQIAYCQGRVNTLKAELAELNKPQLVTADDLSFGQTIYSNVDGGARTILRGNHLTSAGFGVVISDNDSVVMSAKSLEELADVFNRRFAHGKPMYTLQNPNGF